MWTYFRTTTTTVHYIIITCFAVDTPITGSDTGPGTNGTFQRYLAKKKKRYLAIAWISENLIPWTTEHLDLLWLLRTGSTNLDAMVLGCKGPQHSPSKSLRLG